jgi:zinc D-Ala-D-Ala carboxypeptidase
MSVAFVTPHFSWLELACHDGTPVPVELQPNARRLCASLELIRARWGGPLVITSGYRTRAHNVSVGGARMSFHCDALAADIRPVSLTRVKDLNTLIEDMIRDGDLPDVGAVGTYPGWVHVDVRHRSPARPKHIARWGGKAFGSEQTT